MHREAKRYVKIAINLIWALIVTAGIIFFVPKIIIFFMPFLIGWIIALIANPLVKFLEEKLSVKRKAVSGLVIISVLALVILIAYLVIAKLITETIGFVNDLPSLLKSLEGDMEVISKNLDGIYGRMPKQLQEQLSTFGTEASLFMKDIMGNVGTPTVIAVGTFAKNIPSVIIAVIMTILSSYFFTAEKDYIPNLFHKLVPASVQKKWDIVYSSLKTAVGGYFKAQLKIEIWIYLLLVIGLSILNINYAFLIALGIAVLDILPFFGTGIVMWPWAVMKLLSSDYTMSIGLVIIWGVSQLVRQFIQPKIVGDSIGMPAIPTLFLLFAGYKVAGVIGMIIAVPVGIIIYNMNESGIFDTTKTSFRLLIKSMNDFRKYEKEDMDYLNGKGVEDEDKSNRI